MTSSIWCKLKIAKPKDNVKKSNFIIAASTKIFDYLDDIGYYRNCWWLKIVQTFSLLVHTVRQLATQTSLVHCQTSQVRFSPSSLCTTVRRHAFDKTIFKFEGLWLYRGLTNPQRVTNIEIPRAQYSKAL